MMLNAKGMSQEEREPPQVDPDTLKEIQKAKDLMAVIGSLQHRIEGHLGRVFSDAVRKKDPEYLRIIIDELPDGFHKNEMKKYLHTLEHGKAQDDDFYQE
jgi:hypothetical protein